MEPSQANFTALVNDYKSFRETVKKTNENHKKQLQDLLAKTQEHDQTMAEWDKNMEDQLEVMNEFEKQRKQILAKVLTMEKALIANGTINEWVPDPSYRKKKYAAKKPRIEPEPEPEPAKEPLTAVLSSVASFLNNDTVPDENCVMLD